VAEYGRGTAAAQAGLGSQSKQKNPLWWYVLFVALLLALAESVVAAGHLSIKKEAA